MEEALNLRKLYIMRHGERIDFTFRDWLSSCFDEKDNYVRKNLNMPFSVPRRKGGSADFLNDSPLTRVGLHQAFLTGEAMKHSGVMFSHVFCSPSLRCVETCAEVLKASEQTHLSINIEHGLFEGPTSYKDSLPKWMSIEELKNQGFNVSLDYEPITELVNEVIREESIEEYYLRFYLFTTKLLQKYSGNILFVAHGSTLDTCSRQLTGKSPRERPEFLALTMSIPYASVAVVEQQVDELWRLAESPIHPLRHENNVNFEWKRMLD